MKSQDDVVAELRALEREMAALRVEVEELTQERDEARRVAAIALAKLEYEMTDEQINKDALRVANEFGWSCFKEETE